tara:strand:- start:42 stop:1064 length:1023 start_codon:yes stop_codon:yes gene_type:complete
MMFATARVASSDARSRTTQKIHRRIEEPQTTQRRDVWCSAAEHPPLMAQPKRTRPSSAIDRRDGRPLFHLNNYAGGVRPWRPSGAIVPVKFETKELELDSINRLMHSKIEKERRRKAKEEAQVEAVQKLGRRSAERANIDDLFKRLTGQDVEQRALRRDAAAARALRIIEAAHLCRLDVLNKEQKDTLYVRKRASPTRNNAFGLEMGTDAVLELSKQAWDERCEAERALPEAPLWSLETPRERPRQPKPPTRPASARGPRTQKAAAPSRARAAEDPGPRHADFSQAAANSFVPKKTPRPATASPRDAATSSDDDDNEPLVPRDVAVTGGGGISFERVRYA